MSFKLIAFENGETRTQKMSIGSPFLPLRLGLPRDWAVKAHVANNFSSTNDSQMQHNSLVLEKGNWDTEMFNDWHN